MSQKEIGLRLTPTLAKLMKELGENNATFMVRFTDSGIEVDSEGDYLHIGNISDSIALALASISSVRTLPNEFSQAIVAGAIIRMFKANIQGDEYEEEG